MKTKIFTMLIALVCAAQVFAYDFEVDGIYYNFLGGDSVEVTYGAEDYSEGGYDIYNVNGEYNGAVSIPAIASYNNVNYRVTKIGNFAFGDSGLTKLTIGNNVTSIGSCVFFRCASFAEITIPNSVTSISEFVFAACYALETITVEDGNPTYHSAGNCIIETATKTLHTGCKNSIIPVDGNVTSIGSYAFYACTRLTNITIPNSITTIGEGAFYYCYGLTAITIPNSVTTIGEDVLESVSALTKFVCLSAHVSESNLGITILQNQQLDTIIAPASFFDKPENQWVKLAKNIRYIGVNSGDLTPDAFCVINRSFDKLQTLDISATTNTEIVNNAFKGCYKLETLLLPKELETIGYMSFAECVSLQSLDIPATVTEIGDRAFEDCRSIETLTFGGQQPASAPRKAPTAIQAESALQRIGNWAFYNCHELQHLEIPEGVTEVGAAAFYGCTYLEDLTLPASVQSIGDNCFALCSKLQKITCLATTPPTIEAKTFYDVDRSIPLYVPEANINDYANDTYWGEFINPVAAENDGTTNISSITANEGIITRKVFENGTIYILRDGEKYTIDGRKVE